MRRLPMVLISLAVLGILLVVLCTFVQRPYEDVVLDRFGRLVDDPMPIVGGWKWCWPTDKVVRFDRRLHLFQSDLRQVFVGGESLSVRTFAAWKISDPKRFYEQTGGSDEQAQNYLAQKINGTVEQQLGELLKDGGVAELFNSSPDRKIKIEAIEGQILSEINAELKGSEEKKGAAAGTKGADEKKGAGMELAQLGFSRMAFPPLVADAVYKRMVGDRLKQASRLTDEGNAKAKALRSEGELTKDNLDSKSAEEVGPLRGAAEAQAVKILADAMETEEAKDFYQYWKSMELFKNSLTKNTYLVLPSNSPLIEFLLTPPARNGPRPEKK